MFNGDLPGNKQPSQMGGGASTGPQPGAQIPYGGRFANLGFFNGTGAVQPPTPTNTGIVPPHLQPGNQANDMYRSFIRGRLGMGGDPTAQPSYGAGGGRPIQPWIDRPVSFQEGMYGANGGRPIVDFQPRPTTFQEPPAGTGGFYPGGVGGMHQTPYENRPYGMGGYGGFTPMRRSLYDEIG